MSQSVPDQGSDSARQNSVAETLLSPSILEAMPDAVVAVNRQGVIIQANSQTKALFSYTRDEVIGQKIEILVPERQLPEHDLHREQFTPNPKFGAWGQGSISTAGGAMGRSFRWRSASALSSQRTELSF